MEETEHIRLEALLALLIQIPFPSTAPQRFPGVFWLAFWLAFWLLSLMTGVRASPSTFVSRSLKFYFCRLVFHYNAS